MIPDDYLRQDLWDMFYDKFPKIENIEEYTCKHLLTRDCGTGNDCPYFCSYCLKKVEPSEYIQKPICVDCGHSECLHNFPHGKDNAYVCLSIFPTFCSCKEYKP